MQEEKELVRVQVSCPFCQTVVFDNVHSLFSHLLSKHCDDRGFFVVPAEQLEAEEKAYKEQEPKKDMAEEQETKPEEETKETSEEEEKKEEEK